MSRKVPSMSISGIGIQMIMPKTGTNPQSTPPEPKNDYNAPTARNAPPPPPGNGKLVDKTI